MCDMWGSDLGAGDVRDQEESVEVLSAGYGALPQVLIAGRAVEIRGEAAQVVQGILEEWLDNQRRRMEFLKDRETVRKVVRRMNVVHRVLDAWEGVLSVPKEDSRIELPEI